jgi:arylsulfatase A-like enzyme
MQKPHILFILIDSARPDHLGCYGYQKKTSPFVDELARSSTLYENAIAPGAWTLPSMASIMTGHYLPASQRAIKFYTRKLAFLPELISEAGYTTGCVSFNPWVSYDTGFDRGFDKFYYYNRKNFFKVLDYGTMAKLLLRPRQVPLVLFMTEQAKSFIRKNHRKGPTFTYLHYSVHHPYYTPKRYFDLFDNGETPTEHYKRIQDWQYRDMGLFLRGSGRISDLDRRALLNLYDGLILYVDEHIRELTRFLERIGILDDTVVIITADHGEFFGEYGFISHGFCALEEVARVPLIVRHPALFPAGARVDNVVSTIDLFTTLAKIAGADFDPQRFQSEDLREVDRSGREFVLTRHIIAAKGEFPDKAALKRKFSHLDLDRYEGEQIAMRGSDWKFIWFANGNRLLFDLNSLRGEKADLSKVEPEMVNSYVEKLESLPGLIKYAEGGEIFEFEEATKDHLRALGYLE